MSKKGHNIWENLKMTYGSWKNFEYTWNSMLLVAYDLYQSF